jgi:hypothetical protein
MSDETTPEQTPEQTSEQTPPPPDPAAMPPLVVEQVESYPVCPELWAPINRAFCELCKKYDLEKGYQHVSFDRASGSFVIHHRPQAEQVVQGAGEPNVEQPKKGKGKGKGKK